jgi:hypothetical protein
METARLPFGSEFFVFPLLSRNVKVKIYKTILLSIVLSSSASCPGLSSVAVPQV